MEGLRKTPPDSSPGRRFATSDLGEPGHLDLIDRIFAADHVRIGAATLVEAGLVYAGRRKTAGAAEVEELVRELAITVVPFGEAEYRVAVDAFVRFGRGRHRAALNFGDCLAYASAVVAGDSLLYVGDGFTHTDVMAA